MIKKKSCWQEAVFEKGLIYSASVFKLERLREFSEQSYKMLFDSSSSSNGFWFLILVPLVSKDSC